MARPRRVSDEQIVVAIRREARERGADVSIARVAARLGVSETALFKRFGSRRHMMIRALGTALSATWVEALGEGPDDRPLEAQLASVLRRAAEFFEEIMPYLTALRASGIPVRDIARALDQHPSLEMVDAVHAWLVRGAARGVVRRLPAESTALALVGSVQILTFLAHVLDRSPIDRSVDAYVTDVAGLFARALAPTTTAKRSASGRSRGPRPARAAGREREGRRQR